MRPVKTPQSLLVAPLNSVFGSEANVRILRALVDARAALSMGELARRTGVQRPGVGKAVEHLLQSGIIERVGAGPRPLIGLRSAHPLSGSIRALFEAEGARVTAMHSEIRRVANGIPAIRSLWAQPPAPEAEAGSRTVHLGALAGTRELPKAIEQLRQQLSTMEEQQDVTISVRGWTNADLAVATEAEREALRNAEPVAGPPPLAYRDQDASETRRMRNIAAHGDHDIAALALARVIGQRLARDPSAMIQARDNLERRLKEASPGEQHELREWIRVLETMSVSRLQHLLGDRSERATRLRQSLPFTGLLTPQERSAIIASARAADEKK